MDGRRMTADAHLQVLVVTVDQRAGLLADDVHEVLPAVRSAPLPDAPDAIEGVVNLRGSLIPVVDLRTRFALPTRPVRPADRLVVVEAAGRRLALRVEQVVDLLSVPVADVEAGGDAVADAVHTAGVAKLADGLLVICDLSTFLSADDVVVVDAALAAHRRGDRA